MFFSHCLIHQDGQTGVKKASVTIVFNNTDKSASPIGYEKFDQITVTRQVCYSFWGKFQRLNFRLRLKDDRSIL